MPITTAVRWVVPQGATFVAEITFVDPAAANAPVDLTGYSARLQARVTATDPDPPVYATTSGAGGHLSLGGVSGLVTWTIPAAATATFDWAQLVFDLEVESPDGVVYRLIQGRLMLDRNVTR